MNDDVLAPAGLIRQGDVLLVPVDGIPTDGTVRVERLADRHLLAEGEATGHAHVVEGPDLRMSEWSRPRRWWRPEQRVFLVVDSAVGATLVHEEHLPLAVPQGTYEVRRQREYRPAGWAEVAD
jgi:hypothetical protein